MSQLHEHYRLLLSLDEAWQVGSVDLRLAEQRVEIRLEHRGVPLVCPDCGQACPQADLAPERSLRFTALLMIEAIQQSQQAGVRADANLKNCSDRERPFVEAATTASKESEKCWNPSQMLYAKYAKRPRTELKPRVLTEPGGYKARGVIPHYYGHGTKIQLAKQIEECQRNIKELRGMT